MSANNYQVGGNHYKVQGYQHWDFVIDHKIPYMEAQIIRYVSRYRKKNGLEDLHKAKHFIAKMQERWDDVVNNTPGPVDHLAVARFLTENTLDGPARAAISHLCIVFMDPGHRHIGTLIRVLGKIEECIELIEAEPGRGYVDQG